MSRVGKMPIVIPQGVPVKINNSHVSVRGPRGVLERTIHPDINVAQEVDQIVVRRPSDAKNHRALHGLTRALVANMVKGVHEGFERSLELRGVGYRAEVQGRQLNLQIGYSHPVEIPIPDGLEVEVASVSPDSENGYLTARLAVKGVDKQSIGDFAASIRKVRPVEPYKGKGVRYAEEVVRKKLGKAAKGGEGGKG